MRSTPAGWVERRYPNPAARRAADAAIDALPVDATMATYIDVWIAAYRARDGRP